MYCIIVPHQSSSIIIRSYLYDSITGTLAEYNLQHPHMLCWAVPIERFLSISIGDFSLPLTTPIPYDVPLQIQQQCTFSHSLLLSANILLQYHTKNSKYCPSLNYLPPPPLLV